MMQNASLLTDDTLTFQRTATEDADIFIALEEKVANPKIYGPTLNIDLAIRQIVENEFYFIKHGAMVVGTTACRTKEDGSVYISNVAVDPDFQGRGFARAAMEFLIAKNKDAARIELVTHPENEAALKLYASLGFEIESHHENYFGDGEPRLELVRTGTR